MARAKRPVEGPTEHSDTLRQLEHLPRWVGDVITEILDAYARDRGLQLIPWYHDLPIWMLETTPAERLVRRIQVSACADENDRVVLVATGDLYEVDEGGRVARVVRMLPQECERRLQLPLLVALTGEPPWSEKLHDVLKDLPEILDLVWKASESIPPESLEPVGSVS